MRFVGLCLSAIGFPQLERLEGSKNAMCVACGQELCKTCKGCHNKECERYIEPTDMCEIEEEPGPQKGRETKVFFGGFPTYLSASEQAG